MTTRVSEAVERLEYGMSADTFPTRYETAIRIILASHKRMREALEKLEAEAKPLLEGCDHDTNICWCSYRHALEAAAAALSDDPETIGNLQEQDDPPPLEDVRGQSKPYILGGNR